MARLGIKNRFNGRDARSHSAGSLSEETNAAVPEKFEGSFDRTAAAHLLRRAGFGATRERLTRATEAGLSKTLDELFTRNVDDDAMGAGVRHLLALEKIEPIQAHWFALLIADHDPLVERVNLMWHNHFATSFDKVSDSRLMYRQIALFREHGLGDFRLLLHRAAQDPAMLVWLDGDLNRRGQANENFAREVMELFGLGIGNYTEEDIREAARAFTGWGVRQRQFVFRKQYHDPGEKLIFGHQGNFVGEEVIDLVLGQPACAHHIAKRLLGEFVLPKPTDSEVQTWAAVLLEEEWNIGRTLRRLFSSGLFFSDRARRSRIAGPVELLISRCISLGARPAPMELARAATNMGQALLRPPSVKGWDGGRTWIHAGSWIARHEFLSQLLRGEVVGTAPDLTQVFGKEKDEELVNSALELLLPDGVSQSFRTTLITAARNADGEADAARRITTLILTSPDAHLI
ncbi:MAG: hypothetical protein ACI8PQ_002707 [Planctomycetota bacterium]